jgi:hypothetical protein
MPGDPCTPEQQRHCKTQDGCDAGVQPATFVRLVLTSAGEESVPHVSPPAAAQQGCSCGGLAATVAFTLSAPETADRVLNTAGTAYLVRADTKQTVGRARIDTLSLLTSGKAEAAFASLPFEPVPQEASGACQVTSSPSSLPRHSVRGRRCSNGALLGQTTGDTSPSRAAAPLTPR